MYMTIEDFIFQLLTMYIHLSFQIFQLSTINYDYSNNFFKLHYGTFSNAIFLEIHIAQVTQTS